jgi:hypothetical protein
VGKGFSRQVESLIKKPIYEDFQLIVGTSTGAIIVALLSVG